jgi:hypothetical protein
MKIITQESLQGFQAVLFRSRITSSRSYSFCPKIFPPPLLRHVVPLRA